MSRPPAPRQARVASGGRALRCAVVTAAVMFLAGAGAVASSTAPSIAASNPGSFPPTTTASRSEPVPTARDVAVDECLHGGERPVEALEPDHPVPWPDPEQPIADGTAIDARSEVFDNTRLNRSGFGFGVEVDRPGRVGLCFVGGSIRTSLDPEDTPWNTWHRVTAMTVDVPAFTVIGTSFFNQGDLIAFVHDAADWRVVGVRADGGRTHDGAYGHDDCIENDVMASGIVEDSKFDGCLVFLSATHSSVRDIDGGDETVVVRDTLVRLQPFRNSFNTGKYGQDAHGGFFKWAAVGGDVMVPPALSITDSMFRSDTPARYGGNENGFLGLPPGTHCERVLLVGTESWPAEDLASWRDQCTDLELGTVADWDAAVAAWDGAHPPLRELAAQARDAVSGSTGW